MAETHTLHSVSPMVESTSLYKPTRVEIPELPNDNTNNFDNGNAERSPSFLTNQNEGVLRDVLDELDRERSQRAELEARIRILEQDLHAQKQKNAQSHTSLSTRDFITLQAERDGYMQLVNALTSGRPAFSQQQNANTQQLSKQTKKPQTLPLHVIQLLEIIPWDPRAQQHLFGEETVYEWQIMGADKNWQSQLRYFPTVFKTLPIVVPQPGKIVGEAPTSSSPPKQCVLTNTETTHILNIDKGYPLPQDGGDWVWVGSWRIDKSPDADAEGWSYSNDLDLTMESSYVSEFRPPQKGTKNFVRRRRKWSRARVLVDYPQASVYTKQYLKLIAEKTSLAISEEKLSSQLADTKLKLTNLEVEHLSLKDKNNRKITKLKKQVSEQNQMLSLLQPEEEQDASESSSTSKKAQVQELRSVVTAWVNNTVGKRTTSKSEVIADDSNDMEEGDNSNSSSKEDNNDEEVAAKTKGKEITPVTAAKASTTTSTSASKTSSSSEYKQQMFESLKGKGSDLFEKFKQKSGEELEKIKKHKNGATTSLASWAVSSVHKKKTEASTTTATTDKDTGDTKSSSSIKLI